MNISLELVPREKQSFVQEVGWALEHIDAITHINIPDLVRLPTRSWEAAAWISDSLPVIVHVRACDVGKHELDFFYRTICEEYGISHILVVRGDDGEEKEGFSSVEMIRQLHQMDASLSLYAALDPYRQSLKEEMNYVEEKLSSGASGIFTQPFFEEKLLLEYMKVCDNLPVWWGVSPILSGKSLSYWREKNRVPLPSDYDISWEANIQWAKRVKDLCALYSSFSLYFMPIRVDITRYLSPIFEM